MLLKKYKGTTRAKIMSSLCRTKWKEYQYALCWLNLKTDDYYFVKHVPVSSSLITLYNLTVLKNDTYQNSRKILKNHLSVRLSSYYFSRVLDKFDTEVTLNVETVQDNLLQLRWRQNLRKMSEYSLDYVSKLNKKKGVCNSLL